MGPRCGDTVTDSPWEDCDDGVNNGSYNGCNPDCSDAPRCGDAVIDAGWGEECDGLTVPGPGDVCNSSCRLEEACGNGLPDAGEQWLKDWATTKEELYNNSDIFDAHPLAMGKQMVDGKPVSAVVAWTNEKQGARSFSTTIGHNTSTVADDRYLDLVTRGLLWACGKLEPSYQKAFPGKNKITFISQEKHTPAEIKK